MKPLLFRFFTFGILLILVSLVSMGCYSYWYYNFIPEKIVIEGEEISFSCKQGYYDSLSDSWRNFTGDRQSNINVIWEFYINHKFGDRYNATYLMVADTLFIYSYDSTYSLAIPVYNDHLSEIKWDIGFASYIVSGLDEKKYPDLKLKTIIRIIDPKKNEIVKTCPIELKAKYKKGHSSDFMK
jgi:hypothetical protein